MQQGGIRFRKKILFPCLAMMLLLQVTSLFFPGKLLAQYQLPDSIKAEWNRYKNTRDDSLRVVSLSKLAWLYRYYLDDDERVDSLSEASIRIAEMSFRPGLLMLAYNNYLESTDPVNEGYYKKAVGYANKALQNSRISGNLIMRWHTFINLARIYLSWGSYENALLCSNDALAIAHTLKNDTMMAESYLFIAKSNGYKNLKMEAFQNFCVMKDLAEKTGDPHLLIKCYNELSKFYHDNNLFEYAIDYKMKEGAIIQGLKPVDSTALVWIKYGLQLIDVRQKKVSLNEQGVKNILDFAIRTGNNRLKAWEFALYRKHLLESDERVLLYNFYQKAYPGEFKKLYSDDPEMFYRLTALFMEFENKTDSAGFYFKKAEQILTSSPKNSIYLTNFYNRYGQFLIRQGHKREAIEKFTLSYNICVKDAYYRKFEYMLMASNHLEKLYLEIGDYKNAWRFAAVNLVISDSINNILKKDQVMDEEVKLERAQKEMAAEKDRQKIRQGKNETKMMAGAAVFFIIVSLLIYRNFRNQKRLNRLLDEAKKQSDHLLLNILPQETAEELKLTGKAKAKRFDEVTVMFTDFQNFTQASERMSAEKLVDEINFYYSEFDNIISRHNIEKIKIIGDSYMCVGGLPVTNQTHACDVVAAAVEFQRFMLAQKIERSGRGESFFELRIGIHTGPVVAGIVGHKKFAYDIWGDTVNTASRMESTGEIQKVNISGETYEKVKTRFQCTYRGKVTAKNKGEIDMYFVDFVISPSGSTL